MSIFKRSTVDMQSAEYSSHSSNVTVVIVINIFSLKHLMYRVNDLRPKKNICVFTVTCQINLGLALFFIFIFIFYYRQNQKYPIPVIHFRNFR